MPQQDLLSIEQRRIVNKRLSLNLLIQGSATHAFWTAHHLVDRELNAIDPDLLPLYEKMLLHGNLGYWIGGIPLIAGSPTRFWRRLKNGTSRHEFRWYPFLRKHGWDLAAESRERLFSDARKAGFSILGITNEFRGVGVYMKIMKKEAPWIHELESLGIRACHEIYNVPKARLRAQITATPKWGNVRVPKTWRGKMLMPLMVGWGGVVRENGQLFVQGKATVWPLLLHELVKGTVELISLHGLGGLEDEAFELAMDRTEHVEFEFPMIQIGRLVFQKFLAVLPREVPLADCIMHVSRMDPVDVETFMAHMVESPNRATDMIRASAAAA